MEQETERSAERRRILAEYRTSGQTRREFCAARGISLTTLDYWQRAQKDKPVKPASPRLMKVELAPEPEPIGQFSVTLANGRRIESGWQYEENALARLIRVVESA